MKKPIAVVQKTPTLNIYWMLTDFCNFKCSYCPEDLHSGNYHKGRRHGFATNEEIDSFFINLPKHLKDRHLITRLSGGEPTLHPYMPTIVSRFKEHNGFLGVTTNGSRDSDFWKSILPVSAVTISLQPEFTKLDKVIRIARTIQESGTKLDFNLSCDPELWEQTVALYENMDDDLKILIRPKLLNRMGNNRDRSTYSYTEDQIKWIKERIEIKHFGVRNQNATFSMVFADGTTMSLKNLAKITLNEWHAMKGWYCKVGSEAIHISYSGNVYAGICKAKYLGRIDNFELYEDLVSCHKERCTCPSDLRASKSIA
jgi:MoaA/NifB/PqqE/SkfB family radical SAM enzyme